MHIVHGMATNLPAAPATSIECPSCQGAGRHDAIDGQRSATCGTCEGLRHVDLDEETADGCGLAFAMRFAHEWHLRYDYLKADGVVLRLAHEPAAALPVVVHALCTQLSDRIRPCWSCRAVVLDGKCDDCIEHVEVEPEGREYDKYTHGTVAA